MSKVKVVLFDSNETLLDLSALDPHFQRAYGAAEVRKKWFKQVLELCLTTTVIGKYRSFERLADAALDMAARQYGTADGGRELGKSDRASIHAAMLELPAYADAKPALERLRAREVRLAVLTNSTEKSVKAQMKYAGLSDCFGEILSVDSVERYKPARETYEYAAKKLDVDADEIRMVAAHGWDVAGALSAGCRAAFVRRPEKALDPGGDEPDIIADDLTGVADQIIETDM